MKYEELPKIIKSPITNDDMFLMDKFYPNNYGLSVANIIGEYTECIESNVALYISDKQEAIYVPYENGF